MGDRYRLSLGSIGSNRLDNAICDIVRIESGYPLGMSFTYPFSLSPLFISIIFSHCCYNASGSATFKFLCHKLVASSVTSTLKNLHGHVFAVGIVFQTLYTQADN